MGSLTWDALFLLDAGEMKSGKRVGIDYAEKAADFYGGFIFDFI